MTRPRRFCTGRAGAHEDQSAAGGPRRNRREDGRKEYRHQKAQSRHHGCESSPTAFRDPGAALDEGRHRRASQQRSDRDARGINAIGHRRPWKIPIVLSLLPLVTVPVLLHATTKPGHGVERRSAVDDVNIQESKERQGKAAPITSRKVPLLRVECVCDGVKRDNFPEEGESLVTFVCVREVGEGCVAPKILSTGGKQSPEDRDGNDLRP